MKQITTTSFLKPTNMNKYFTFFGTLFLLIFTQNINAQTYVNAAAAGDNDGSSWINAYTELHDALENYTSGDEIWVAAGTYLPQVPSTWPGDAKNTFYLYQDLTLYGGFNGTETTLADRNSEINITFLSGDLNGDDIALDFENNRSDNAINVMDISTNVTPSSIIDGFTIQNGHAGGDTTFLYNQRGGGIFSYGSPQIRNCRFTENYTELYGGGLYLGNVTADEAVVEDCIFEGNKSDFRAGGMIVASTGSGNEVQVNNCQFIGNIASSSGGALYTWRALTSVDSCQFSENYSEERGGAIYILSNNNDAELGMTIVGSDFENNVSANGGAFYFASDGGLNFNIDFNSCNFIDNEAAFIATSNDTFPDGGAIRIYYSGSPQNNTISMEDCLVQGNSSDRNAGGVSISGTMETTNLFEVNNCQFIENTAINGGAMRTWRASSSISNCQFSDNSCENVGGAINIFSNNDDIGLGTTIVNSDFENNVAQYGGGFFFESYNGGNYNLSFNSCNFVDNEATDIAGAIFVWYNGDDPQNNTISMEDCLLQGNTAEIAGGIWIDGSEGTGNLFEMNNCEIFENTSEENTGGIAMWEGGINNSILVRNTHFKANDAPLAGSVGVGRDLANNIPSPTGQRTEFINCLFTEHPTSIELTAAAGVLGEDVEMDLINCTFTDNNAPNLITYQDGRINLQNTILNSTTAPNFTFGPTMTGAINSLGGNLISDNSIDIWKISTDQSSVDPLLEGGTFKLTQNSTGVDAGLLPDNVSEFDIEGNDRIQGGCIDIGAFESTFDNGTACVTATREVLVENNDLTIFPNPISDMAKIQLENEWQGSLNLQIINTLGQLVHFEKLEKNIGSTIWELDLNKLNPGAYQLILSDGQKMITKSIVKF